MAVPNKLRVFTVYIDGENKLGRVTSFTPPKLTRKTESFRGAGMPGSVSVDFGLDDGALDLSFAVGGADAHLFSRYAGSLDEVCLRFSGEYYSDADIRYVDIEVRGRITEIDMGEAKQGEDTEHSYSMKNTWYRLSVDDREKIEFDVLNFIWRIDGKDVLPDRTRSMLGF
ncbi:phage major tail tube protein [Escherichia coli]|uniref:phage major tail tube protein n=1 Tax=Escherichia coli TaxID=562 RepID=UPI0007A06270|nr:phage major tail tube protein [Escherichia coli]EEC8395283.1 phage major tail tube protein [Escherichia coli]EEQ2198902.1 phage major tail tube protein [Escherichia coli]EET1949916.1 phage major tail tube protein [Escherichia coli]EET8038636.1 phage major tail tube protein [Escherichia coli]EEY8008097.1 phage major tail tube protein [Escherichia coli]